MAAAGWLCRCGYCSDRLGGSRARARVVVLDSCHSSVATLAKQIWNSGDVQVELFGEEQHAMEEGRRAVNRERMGRTKQRAQAGLAHKALTVGDVVAFVKGSVKATYKMYGSRRHNCQDVSRQVFNWAK